MVRKITALMLAALMLPCICNDSHAQKRQTRPRIGVVLSGGGAKGAAHIGVLKVLEEYGIPVDCVVGTSMGAIIGGLYSMGYKANEIDSIISVQDWDFVMSDRIPRESSSFEDKQYEGKYIARVPFSMGNFGKAHDPGEDTLLGSVPPKTQSLFDKIPIAVVNGQNIYNLFTSLTVGYQDSIDFNKMPIPFACVAVDVVSRKEVVWRNGNVVDAIRSSMAIPGYFAPVKIGDMVLVDGGARNNYPVDVARSLGADIIIGVKLGKAEEARSRDVNNISDMFSGLYDMYAHEKYESAIGNTDILIRPSIKGFGMLDFDRESIAALIENGRLAALEQAEDLKRLKAYLDECSDELPETFIGPVYDRKQYKKAVHLDKDTIALASVTYNGLNQRDAQLLLNNSLLKAGSRVTGRDIDREISRFYNTAVFESVTYQLKGKEEPYDMVIDFVPGHNSELGLGFRVDTEEASVIQINAAINKFALYGPSLSVTGKLSVNPMASVRYSYSFPGKWRANAEYQLRSSNPRLLHNDLLNGISFLSNSARASISTRGLLNLQTEAGLEFTNFKYGNFAHLDFTDALSVYDQDFKRRNFLGAFLKLKVNSLNDDAFPTRGWVATGGVNYHMDAFDFSNGFGFLSFNAHYSQAFTFGHTTVIPALYHRSILGSDVPMAYMNTMGGTIAGRYMDQQIPFIGFNNAVTCEKILTVGSLEGRVRITGKHYAVASASYALEDDDLWDTVSRGTIGARLGYTYRSAVGPLSFYLNWSDRTGAVGWYAIFGYSF